ncbi:MAG: tRNA lysidine(34) synthetase TilS [Pseudomonadota bacterium]
MKSTLKSPSLLAMPATSKGARVWLAFSGGLDSTALLHLLHAQGTKNLRALHIHHGLQDTADEWAKQCQTQCRKLKVPFEALHVKIDPANSVGPEAAARMARYNALHSRMREGDILVTAHHRDDQAETVLLRLLRGAGVAGLAAMRPVTVFAPGVLWRPLLQTPRSEILAYAKSTKLKWIEDPHNYAPRYARSYLRQEVMPRLREHWPQTDVSLARAAEHCAEANELLDELAQQDLNALRRDETLSVVALQALSAARRRNAIRYWLSERGFEAPAAAMLQRLEREVLLARVDAQPLLNCGAYEFRRYRDQLHVMSPLPLAPKGIELQWDGKGRFELPVGCGVLTSNARKALPHPLTICFASGGETLRTGGASRTRTLKNLFQEAAVPQWQRLRMPLIYSEGRLVSVADRWLGAEWSAELARRKLRITWRDV